MPYVPQSAALVYEVGAAGNQWKAIQQATMSQGLVALPFYKSIQESLHWLESLGINTKAFDELPLMTSIHGLSEAEIGYIFYFHIHANGTKPLLKILEDLQQSPAYQLESSQYAGYKITAIGKPGIAKKLHFMKKGPYIMASFSSLLLEDIIRGLVQKNPHAFLPVQQLANKQGSIYINFPKIASLLRVFLKHDYIQSWKSILANFATAAQLELKVTDHYLLLNGFTANLDTIASQNASPLTNQDAGLLHVAPYIPLSTAFLQHFTYKKPEALAKAWQQYRQTKNTTTSYVGTVLNPLLNGEIGLCTIGTTPQEQVLLIQVHHSQAFLAALQELQLLTQPCHLSLKNHLPKVYTLPPKAFADWLPGQLFPGFQPSVLTTLDNYVLLADSKAALENFIKQHSQGNTWAKNTDQQAFLGSLLEQAHCRLFVNIQQAWPQLMQALKPAWKQFFEEQQIRKNFKQASLQIIPEKQDTTSQYLSLLLQYTEPPKLAPTPRTTAIVPWRKFKAEAPIITKPFIMPTHKKEAFYILFQDALYQLYCLNSTGQLCWKKSLEGPIASDIFAIDVYRNNKWQYLWATQEALHLIDYTGKPIKKYPHQLPFLDKANQVKLQVIDYLQDKNYRFLLASAAGNIYLKDIHYRPLPGWNPKALGNPFASTPFHARIKHDYFFALQQTGVLQVFNRKGHACPGFPLDLGEKTHNPLIIKPDNTRANTQLIMLTDSGKLCYYNLAGIRIDSIQCPSTTAHTNFVLCPAENTSPSYSILRQDTDKYAILDEKGGLCFEKNHESAQALLCQYYDFGTHKFYVITDQEHDYSHIIDHQGNTIHSAPLPNSQPVMLSWMQDKAELIMHSNYKDQALAYVLPLAK